MIKESMLFLYFNKNCQAALTMYENIFDANILERVTYGEAKMSEKEEEKSLIMNSTFTIGGMKFCANDVLDDSIIIGNQNTIWLEFSDEQAIQNVYTKLKDNKCIVISQIEETFWNSTYAKIKDPFGIIWELNYQK